MSRRPRGPSERPQFFFDDDLEAADAPRLQGQGFLSKVMVTLLTLCCCGMVALVVIAATSLSAQLSAQLSAPLPAPLPATAVVPPTPIHKGDGHSPRRRQQRSVLRRLAMVQRARAPQKGIDLASVQLAFPHWLDVDGAYDMQAVLSDVILALSYLAQEDVE